MEGVKIDGQELYFASPDLRDNFDIVYEAVKNKGLILKYASKKLRANKEIVKVAIESDKNLLEDEEIKQILE